MKINVVYLPRRVEGRLAPMNYIFKVEQDMLADADEAAAVHANEVASPNELGDEWSQEYEISLEQETASVEDAIEQLKHTIVWQTMRGCPCCEHQLDAYYPWEADDPRFYSNTWLNNYGTCEACGVDVCECVKDHSQHLTRNSF